MKRFLTCVLPVLVMAVTGCEGNLETSDSAENVTTKVIKGAKLIDVIDGGFIEDAVI